MAETYERLGIQLYIDDSALKGSALSFSAINKAIGEVSKLTDDLSKKLSSTFGADLEKNARSLSGKLTKFLGFEKAGEEAKQLKAIFKEALTMEGIAAGVSKLQKFDETMVKVGNSAYNVKTQAEELKRALRDVVESGNISSTKISVLSKDKYEAEIQRMGKFQAQAYEEDVKRKEDADAKKRRSEERLASDIIALERRVQAERDAIQRQRDQQALAAIKAGSATPYNPGITTKSSYVWDVGTAQSMANTEQIKRTLADLSKQSYDAKITAQQVGEAFKKAGIDVAHLDGMSLNKLNSGVKQLGVSLDGTSGKFKEVTQKTTGWASAIDHTLKRLVEFYSIRQVIFAISAQFRDAITGAIDFNQNIHDIAAISGASTKEMQQLGDSILGIARNSRFTANEVAKLMQVLAQAGVSAKDMPTVSDAVGKFATATASDPKVAADVFTTSMNVFRLDATQSTRVLNALTAALNNSKLETEGLATAFNYLAPQAAQFGYSLEQTLGIVAGMSQAGVKSSTIGTGVSQLLKEFAAPKERLKQMLAHYKISAEEINPISHSFVEIVDRLNDAGVKAEHLFQALESRVGRSVVTALQIGGEEFQNMTNSITGTNAGIIAFNKSMEGARAKLNVIKQELLTAVIGVGDTLSPIISGFIDFITALVKGLNTVPGQILMVTGALVGLGAALYTVGASAAAFLAIAGIPALPVVAAVVALTGALYLLGSAQDENVAKSDALIKSLTKTSEATQAVKDGVTKVVTFVERTHQAFESLKKMSEEEREIARNSAEISKTTLNLKTSQKKALYELASAYPQYFTQIDIEKLKYGQLLEILKKVNAERRQGEVSAAAQYNENAEQIKKDTLLAKEYRDKIAQEGSRGVANPLDLYFAKTTEKRIEALKEKQKALRTTLGQNTKYDPRLDNWSEKTEADLKKEKEEEAAAKRSPKDPLNFKRGQGAASENTYAKTIVKGLKDEADSLKAALKTDEDIIKDVEKSFEDRQAAYERAQERLSKSSTLEMYAEIINRTQEFASKNKLKGYDPKEHKEALLAGKNITLNIDPNNEKYKEFKKGIEEYANKSKEVYEKEGTKLFKEFTKTEKKLQEDFDKEVDSITKDSLKRREEMQLKALELAYSSMGVGVEVKEKAYYDYLVSASARIREEYKQKMEALDVKYKYLPKTEENKKNYEKAVKDLQQAENDAKVREAEKAAKTAIEGTNKQVSKKEFNSDLTNKLAQQKISLEKDQATTPEKVRELDTQAVGLEIDNTSKKKEAYEIAVKDLQLKQDAITKQAKGNKLTDEQKIQYEAFGDAITTNKNKLEEINGVLEGQINKFNQLSDNSFWTNFKEGVAEGNKALGTFASNTQNLGKTIVSTFEGGITDTIMNTVSALKKGENAWTAFRNTVGNILMQIGDEIMKYAIRMMIIKPLLSAVGSMMGFSEGGQVQGFSEGGQVQAFALGGRVQYLASGGLSDAGGFIPNNVGISGKDSVPAMLMPGEYVIKKDMVDLYGVEYLKALNSGQVKRFAEGGVVGNSPAGSSSGKKDTSTGTPYSFSIINVADVNSIPPIDGQAVVNIVSFDAAKKGPIYHTIKGVIQG